MQPYQLKSKQKNDFAPYSVGDQDIRPWGSYVVLRTNILPDGNEVCEKMITVSPGKILSLQSREYRSERWHVVHGHLTVICNDRCVSIKAGESIDIPKGAVHCMANLTLFPVKVSEIQTGICREDDIVRYMDAYNRIGEIDCQGEVPNESISLYQDLLERIKEGCA